MKQREFRNKVVSHLGIYKDRVLNLKNKGLYKDKEYEHIINVDKTSNKEDIIKKYNLMDDYTRRVVEMQNIELHTYANHLNSSQVMCINFFSHLVFDENGHVVKNKENQKLKNLLEMILNIKLPTVCTISKESRFEKKEEESSENTNFDLYIEIQSPECEHNIKIYFEIKYTEDGFGKISKDKSLNISRINNYNDVYYKMFKESLYYKNLKINKIENIKEENFYFNEFIKYYQLYRNILRIKNENEYVVFLYPFESDVFNNEINELLTYAVNKGIILKNVRCIDWHDIYSKVKCLYKDDQAIVKYYDSFSRKYLDYDLEIISEHKKDTDLNIISDYKKDIDLPNILRGRNIFSKVIPTVCNLKLMLKHLEECQWKYENLPKWAMPSFRAYKIDRIITKLITSSKEQWKDIIRNHILSLYADDIGASLVDIYFVAYCAEHYGVGLKNILKLAMEKHISENENSANAIYAVGKGDGIYLNILNDDGTIKDYEFFRKWLEINK